VLSGGSVELRDYLSILAARRHLVVAVFAAAIVVACAVTLLQPAKWTAVATLRVEPSTSLVGGTVQADDVKYLDRVVNTYSQLAASPEMRNRVAAELQLAAPPNIEFAQVPNTNLVKLKVTTADRASAAPAARRVTSLLISQVETIAAADVSAAERSFLRRTRRLELEKAQAQAELESLAAASAGETERTLLLREQISGMSQRLEALRADHERYQSTREANERAVTLVAEPSAPQSPENRNLKLALALAILLASVAGPGMAFLAENLSRRFRSHDEIEASVDAPVLSAVPAVDGMSERALFNGNSPAEDAFHRLRTTMLLHSWGDDRASDAPHTVLVTSAYPGEGKSTIVANLGRSLAQAGRSTLLVDADLRRPVLHELFDIENDGGLGDLLRDTGAFTRSHARQLVRTTGIWGLTLLPAGNALDDSASLLGLDSAFSSLLAELGDGHEYVLIDSPAVLSVPDALAISHSVDGVLLVAGSNVRRDALHDAHQQLTRVGANVLGVVVNGAGDPGLYPYVDYGPRIARRGVLGR
jgi:capsular exopolysaccharide synthesis family protein